MATDATTNADIAVEYTAREEERPYASILHYSITRIFGRTTAGSRIHEKPLSSRNRYKSSKIEIRLKYRNVRIGLGNSGHALGANGSNIMGFKRTRAMYVSVHH